MEFLRTQGVPYREVDVSRDQRAAQEIMRRTGQTGVPVITDAQEAIIGFNLPKLQQMAARHTARGLGLRVKDASEGGGAYVGSLRAGSPGEQAGVLAGDEVEELSGLPVNNAADLERIARNRRPGQLTSITVRRNGERKTLIIPG